jgi:membrane protease YdiL (CAAX protease family)
MILNAGPSPNDPKGDQPQAAVAAVPWSRRDSWIGVGLAMLASLAGAGIAWLLRDGGMFDASALALYELLYLVPVIPILVRRTAGWRSLGFRQFKIEDLGLGCGLLFISYAAIIVHNAVLMTLGWGTQAEALLKLVEAARWPWGIALGGVIAAPLVEEIVFRGFFFQGLRQVHGWNKAALISSAVFAAMHLQLEALFPTFILGYALAFIFHRAKSIWPGMILHMLVNALGICVVLAATQWPGVR